MPAKFKTLTKPQIAKQTKLHMALDAAKVACFAGEMHVPFNQAYLAASDAHRKAHDEAWRAVMNFEHQMVAEGRGYFDRWYIFRAY